MRANQDVHLSLFYPAGNIVEVPRGLKSGDDFDGVGPVGKSVTEVGMMLVGKQRSRDQDGALTPALSGDECCSHCHLGFTKTDIAADQAIHHPWSTHVILYGGNCRGLIRRFFERKALAKFEPLGFVQRVRVPLPGLSPRIHVQKLRCHISCSFPCLAARLLPLLAAEPV